jgi:hypothetical protein
MISAKSIGVSPAAESPLALVRASQSLRFRDQGIAIFDGTPRCAWTDMLSSTQTAYATTELHQQNRDPASNQIVDLIVL